MIYDFTLQKSWFRLYLSRIWSVLGLDSALPQTINQFVLIKSVEKYKSGIRNIDNSVE